MDFSYDNIMDYVSLYYTTGVRWVCVGLAVLILGHQLLALLRMRNPSEIWAYLRCPDGSSVPLTHWENLVGRGRGCDIILNLSSVSRSHATLIRDSAGVWKYKDLNSKNGSYINGNRVFEPTVLKSGDVLTLGGEDFELYPVSLHERMENIAKRKRKTQTTSPWFSMLALTVFQILTVIQFKIALGEDCPSQLIPAYVLLCILMWTYVIVMRIFKRNGFEIELIAFFLCTLSLAVTTSAYPGTVLKQSICVTLGVIAFFGMCWLLRDLNKAKRLRYIFVGISVFLLIINLALGSVINGSQNWVTIGGFSIQPSELVKIVFIYVGAATLDELQERKNMLIFLGFSVFCLGALAIMGDFGTAMIFFVTYLVISFLRSGDFTKLFLVIGGAGLMGLMVLRFKPYVATRFATWGHVWDDPTGAGYQQVQTMTSIASGGLPGLGAGEGNLSDVAAASTDLVFGLMSEEWGLIIAVLAVLCIITLGVFAFRCIIAGRSTYYNIAACATTSLFMFQTILNVFGSLDLFPLTGVTFPFVSSGGTSMIVSWIMLAYLKAADTRQNASIAIKLHDSSLDDDISIDVEGYTNTEDFYREIEGTAYYDFLKPSDPPRDYEAERLAAERATREKAEAERQERKRQALLEVARRRAERAKAQQSVQQPVQEKITPENDPLFAKLSEDDDAFFRRFENTPSANSEPQADDGPLTLDDIFGYSDHPASASYKDKKGGHK
ncbi:MAG: FtsW/RodA/SpoVE family cell cycle protein [Firmicutes bacterium]|nr:FtsW/RodA/SpoVE family cell cycle protein [Bacillota bacterium]